MSSSSDSLSATKHGNPIDETRQIAANLNAAFEGGPPPRRRRAWWLPLAALVLAGFLVVFGWRRQAGQRAAAASVSAAALVPSVHVHVVTPAQAASQLTLPATLEPVQQTEIHARASGYVRRWLADMGQKVAAGDVLAEIETPELDQDLRKAEAAVGQSRAALALARTTAERFRQLMRDNAVAQQELDTREAELAAREAELKSAEAALLRVRELARFQSVTAPFEGVVTSRNVEVGDLVVGGVGARGLFVLEQVDTLRAFVDVPQAHASAVRPGMKARFLLPEAAGRHFEATVVRTAGALNPITRSMRLELRIPNPGAELMAGAFGQVRIAAARQQQVFPVPVTAVRIRAEGPYVSVVDENGRIRIRPVKIGHDLGTEIEILDGLAAGERVVRNPTDLLSPGTNVHIAQATVRK